MDTLEDIIRKSKDILQDTSGNPKVFFTHSGFPEGDPSGNSRISFRMPLKDMIGDPSRSSSISVDVLWDL